MDQAPEYFVINPDMEYDCIPHPIFISMNVLLMISAILHLISIFTVENTNCELKCGSKPKTLDV